jgi:hypothetical protein
MTNTTNHMATIHAEGILADRNARIARKCTALGMTEHAADARNRQARMLDHLHEVALADDRKRSL